MPGSQTKNLSRPEESKVSPPAYTGNTLKEANLIAISHRRSPEKQLPLFELLKS